MAGSTRHRILFVAPVYRDWESAAVLCRALDEACAQIPDADFGVLLVDDGSPGHLERWETFTPRALKSMHVLFLKRNLGHQRAITIGLCHVYNNGSCDAVVVMDADGEDRPEDAVLLAKREMEAPGRLIFAGRQKRLEKRIFRIGYVLYRALHRFLTGISVRVGNFSVVPRSALGRLLCMSEMWNHYAGAVFKSKLEYEVLPINRGRRYRGTSHMSVTSLVNHGLAGIASFHDVAATRILVASGLATLVTLAMLLAVVAIRFLTDWAIPGWATYAGGLLLVLLLVIVATSFNLVFTLIASRSNDAFVPIRDYKIFVDRLEAL